MVSQVSGRVPVAEDRRHLQGQVHDRKVKREEGAYRLRFHSVGGKAGKVEVEKKTNAHHV
jgi:hypothetical protein